MKKTTILEADHALFSAINIAILVITISVIGFAGYLAYDFYTNECADYNSIVSCVSAKSVSGGASAVGGATGLAVTSLFQWGMKIAGRDPQATGEDSPSWWPNFLPW